MTDPTAAILGAEGTEPPSAIPAEVFQAGLETFLDGRRLDMQALAADVGIGRSTLYRKAGSRDELLGAVIWYLTRRAIGQALAGTAELEGTDRILAVTHRFMHDVNGQRPLHAFLEREPETALRILTSPEGPVQGGLAAALERLIVHEQDLGNLKLTIDPTSLSYVIVRIGESFLYADVIADNQPDLDLAVELIGRLLREPA